MAARGNPVPGYTSPALPPTHFMRKPPADVYPRENRPSCCCSAVVPNLRAVSAWRIPLTYTPPENRSAPAQSSCGFRLTYTPRRIPQKHFCTKLPCRCLRPAPRLFNKIGGFSAKSVLEVVLELQACSGLFQDSPIPFRIPQKPKKTNRNLKI